jgi:hypothetical protein
MNSDDGKEPSLLPPRVIKSKRREGENYESDDLSTGASLGESSDRICGRKIAPISLSATVWMWQGTA